MKKVLIIIIAVIFITLLIPLAAVYIIDEIPDVSGPPREVEETETAERTVNVYVHNEDKTEEMDINDYLKAVVAAEMPSDFAGEALKAQAVAARTYLFSHIEQVKNGNAPPEHPDAAVCTDYRHCQAYTPDKSRITDKVSAAVEETDGKIMTYNGEIISALFHSTSSGKTENAKDVWGSEVPYLKSVKSEGDIESPKYESERSMSVEEFKNIAEANVPGADWSKGLFSDVQRSEAGGIITIRLGGAEIKGTQLRSVFDLRSTNAEIEEKDGEVKISVKGYGHGVGMSQYGADYMARNGKTYDEILKTYYTGIEIEQK